MSFTAAKSLVYINQPNFKDFHGRKCKKIYPQFRVFCSCWRVITYPKSLTSSFEHAQITWAFVLSARAIELPSLWTQTHFRQSLVSAENNVCKPEPGNDFCDVGILSQSHSSSPRTTARGIRCEEHSSFILSLNLIGQGETKVITSQKSFPGSGSQTFFSAETSDSWKYVCVRRLRATITNVGFYLSFPWQRVVKGDVPYAKTERTW